MSATPGSAPSRFEPLAQGGLDRLDAIGPRLAEQHVDARPRHRGSEGVPHEGGPVHQRPGLGVAHPGGHRIGAERRRHREVPPGERLAEAEDVGGDAGVLAREERAGAAEPGGDLVGDEQDVVLIAERSHRGQVAGRVEVHAAGALHDRFEDDGRHLVGVALQERSHLLEVAVLEAGAEDRGRPGREELRGEHVGELVVHAVHRVAHRHGGEGVAVVAAPHGEQAMAVGPAPPQPVLDRHLDGDLHRDRAGVGEEHPGQAVGDDLDEAPGQVDGGRMGQTAEHHVRHLVELADDRGVQRRVVVAVDRRPPRRHAVDELPSVRQGQADPAGRDDGEVGDPPGARCVGMPHLGLVELHEISLQRLLLDSTSTIADFGRSQRSLL